MVTKIKYRLPRKIKKQIPRGHYCYTITGPWKGTHLPVKNCKFWIHSNPFGNGDCRLFSPPYNGSTDNNFDFCLDDQCKACDVKMDYTRSSSTRQKFEWPKKTKNQKSILRLM